MCSVASSCGKEWLTIAWGSHFKLIVLICFWPIQRYKWLRVNLCVLVSQWHLFLKRCLVILSTAQRGFSHTVNCSTCKFDFFNIAWGRNGNRGICLSYPSDCFRKFYKQMHKLQVLVKVIFKIDRNLSKPNVSVDFCNTKWTHH